MKNNEHMYWTDHEIFSFFGQVYVFIIIFRNKPTFLQSISTWLLWMIVIITIVVYCCVFSILEMYVQVYILKNS